MARPKKIEKPVYSDPPVETLAIPETSKEVSKNKVDIYTYTINPEGLKVLNQLVRTYSLELHGKDYKDLAKQFIEKNKDKQYVAK